MKTRKTAESIPWLLLSASLVLFQIAPPLIAQTRKPGTTSPKPAAKPTPRETVPTFETLLAAESYKIYAEVRGVGQLIRSAGVNDLLDPIMKLTAPPKEFRTIVKWLNTRADAVMTSRMMFASWPTRAKLPQFLCAIEFETAEEALKFEPQLRAFLPKVLPRPEPSPEASPVAGAPKNEAAPATTKASEPAELPYLIKHSGTLVLITDSPFTFKNLRPTGSKLLGEEQNFRLARDRFTAESIFIYFDVGLEDKSVPKPSPSPAITIANEVTDSERQQEIVGLQQMDATVTVPEELPTQQFPPDASAATPDTISGKAQTSQGAVIVDTPSGDSGPTPESSKVLLSLTQVLFGGQPNWPEAVGAAIVFEADSYIIRTLLINGPEIKASSIPFIPQLVSGPALVPSAPSILPADTELFIVASLDYPQIYDGMVRAMASSDQEISWQTGHRKVTQAESPLAAFEKSLGIKFKDSLIPLLGNEIAVSVPVKALYGAPSSPTKNEQTEDSSQKPPPPSTGSPLIAIAIKDREAVRILIPKLIDSMGFNGASLLAETEKRDDTELISYANVISYAFVGDFLVLSLDTVAVRHVVDAYLRHETLASDSHFRNSTRWQPHQVLGQIYVSPALMEIYNSFTRSLAGSVNEKLQDFVAGLSPTSEPVTYALSNEGMGPLHELHVPKNLVMLMVAGISGESEQSSLAVNEAVAQGTLRTIASAQATFQATEGDGRFASLDELASAGLITKEAFARNGYRIEVTASGKEFEASAVPHEYGKTGKMSYFLDQTSVLRGGDHGGGPATIADKPVQ